MESQGNGLLRLASRIIGGILIAFAVIGVAVEIDDSTNNRVHDRGIAIALIGICAISGGLLFRAGRRRATLVGADGHTELSLESAALRLAKRFQGRLTPTELATDTGHPFTEAQAELQRLAKLGACQTEVSEDGVMVYRFPEFETADAKQRLL